MLVKTLYKKETPTQTLKKPYTNNTLDQSPLPSNHNTNNTTFCPLIPYQQKGTKTFWTSMRSNSFPTYTHAPHCPKHTYRAHQKYFIKQTQKNPKGWQPQLEPL